MSQFFESFRIMAMEAVHMPQVMAIQSICYTAIEPESLAAMESKRAAGLGLAQVALRQTVSETVDPAWPAGNHDVIHQPDRVDAYVIAMPICWPELPALNSEPLPAVAPDTLYVHDLAIHPRARGTGLGPRLLQAVQKRADAMGLRQSALVAIQGSVPFWQRQGFVCVPTPVAMAEKLGSYGDARLMVRDLAVHG